MTTSVDGCSGAMTATVTRGAGFVSIGAIAFSPLQHGMFAWIETSAFIAQQKPARQAGSVPAASSASAAKMTNARFTDTKEHILTAEGFPRKCGVTSARDGCYAFPVLRRSFILLAFVACATSTHQETGFLDRSIVLNGTRYPYTVYVPRNWTPDRAWPVILSLHGAGERGNDGVRQMQIGAAAAIRSHPDRVPAIVVFPQAPAETRWLGEPADAAMGALEEAIVEFHGDRDRVYLTGLSMGGYGTIHLGLAHRDRFAALVVVCGGLFPHPSTTAVQTSPLVKDASDPYAFVARSLRDMPVWLFHGDNDTVIPPDESRKLIAAWKAEGAPDVHYTEYPGVGHNAWDRAYREPELWTWLFAQKRRASR